VAVKITDGSIRGLAPTHPGVLVFYIGELGFTTDIIGDSPEFTFNLAVASFSVLFIDNLTIQGAGPKQASAAPANGGTYWKVRPMMGHSVLETDRHLKGAGYALLAETVNLDLRFQSSNVASVLDTRVRHTRRIPRRHKT